MDRLRITQNEIVLGNMPSNASPKTHIASGPWCFYNQEQKFKDWENTFTFAPEPLTNIDLLEKAAKQAQTLCIAIIPKLKEFLSQSSSLPDSYWYTLLTPWAINMAKLIVERTYRVEAMISQWKDHSLTIQLLPKTCKFYFEDEASFVLHGSLGVTFNHWLFSRLLENICPTTWNKQYLPSVEEIFKNHKNTNLISNVKSKLKSVHLKLLFPKLKGISIWQAIFFSLALLNNNSKQDNSIDLTSYIKDSENTSLKLLCNPFDLFKSVIPNSILNLSHPTKIDKCSKSHLRVASVVSYEDANYRQKLAIWKAQGNRLAYIQHGGNYGQVRFGCDIPIVEYNQHAFFTWGWDNHGKEKGNFIPMPYPQLSKIADLYTQKTNDLLFIGTEMSIYPYRLDSHPSPLQTLDYRHKKQIFLENLSDRILQNCLYRPYFNIPGTFTEAPWIKDKFPNLKISKGNLLPQMLGCRLLVIDHHGTTMLEAMAANIPMILFWNEKAWPLTDKCNEYLKLLKGANIWFSNPIDAAKHINYIWDNPISWWNSQNIQNIRQQFCKNYAFTINNNENFLWYKILRKI